VKGTFEIFTLCRSDVCALITFRSTQLHRTNVKGQFIVKDGCHIRLEIKQYIILKKVWEVEEIVAFTVV